MQDLAFFFSPWFSGFQLKTGAESGKYKYERDRDFLFLWGVGMWNSQGQHRRIMPGFPFLRDLINWPAQNHKLAETILLCAQLCSVLSNGTAGSVSCEVLSNVSIIASLRKNHEIVWGPGLWHQWHLSISDIFEGCFCNLNTPILSSFSNLSTFLKALGLFQPGWPHRMVMIVICRKKYTTL